MGNLLFCCKSKRVNAGDILDDDLNTLKPGDARLKLSRDAKSSKILDQD